MFPDVLVPRTGATSRQRTNPRQSARGLVDGLAAGAQRLLAASVSRSTQRTYQVGISAYQRFSRDIQCQQTPATEHILCLFLAWLHQMGLSADTAQVYLAGVRYLHLQHGMDLTAFQGHQVGAAMRGMQRL